jgi:hypothetical protein
VYYANAEKLWYNNNIIKDNIMEEKEWGSIEYPITLGYTKPNGEKYKVVIHNSDQSEDEYDKMFELCGQDVPFSVD